MQRGCREVSCMQLDDALAADPAQRFCAAAAEVMHKEQGVVVPDYLPADVARVSRSPRMRGFTGGHPEERYRSWNNRVTLWEWARLCAVRCGRWS